MAPHWKCGSGQPVAGSNPALSAISARRDGGRCLRWHAALLAHASGRCARSGARRRFGLDRPRGVLRPKAALTVGRCLRCRLRSLLTHPEVRSLRSSTGAFAWDARRDASFSCFRCSAPPRPSALAVCYGPRQHDSGRCCRPRTGVSFPSRARRGTSGALYLQSAPAGLNSLPRSQLSNAARRCDVEDRVPRSGEPRTVSGPEGSSTKRSSSGAAERPGPSRSSWWAREFPGRRRVHGTLSSPGQSRRRS